MLIKTTVKNEQINLSNIVLDISKKGIYLLQGENGAGKSSLVKQIIYGKNDITFNSEEQEEKYHKNRSDLISYVEQDPIPYHCSVKNYIYKVAEVKDDESVLRLMEKFELDNIKLDTNIEKLSGGELVKLNIIAAIIKKTPYIIMDEPTNNLDNPSVRKLALLIEELKSEYTFLIVSHDPRLQFEDYSVIKITKTVDEVKGHEAERNCSTTPSIKYPKRKLAAGFLTSPYSILSIFSIAAFFCLCVVLNLFVYFQYMNTEGNLGTKDVIISYKVDQQYDELNETYVKHEGLDIEDSKYYQMIYFQDIEKISEMGQVEKIILPDTMYIDQISSVLNEASIKQTVPDKLPVIAVPYDILSEYGGQLLLPCDLRMMTEGRLPYDNADEVVISEALLENVFGMKSESAIDRKITINGKEYTIVGIGYYDVCMLSFDEEADYGYFVYDKKGSKEKINDIRNYLESEDYYISNGLHNTIIYTKEGCEKEVLNTLICEYPAENYISVEFQNSHKSETNKIGNIILCVVNLIFALLSAVVIISTLYKAIKLHKNKATAYDNYFCLKNRTLTLYKWCGLYLYIVIFLIVFMVVFVKFRYLCLYMLIYPFVFCVLYYMLLRNRRGH